MNSNYIEYDSTANCYVFWKDDEGICLGANTMEEAIDEVESMGYSLD